MTEVDSEVPSRYVIGLDLGTTNSAMAYVDTTERPRRIQTFAVPQIVAPEQIEAREILPSFHYEPANGEFAASSLILPWKSTSDYIVGHFARDHGTLVPGRLISSAKSWLCHNGVDRNADLLPWHGAEDVTRLSPVTVSSRYLEQFRHAWDYRFPEYPMAQQDFVLTIPASFDEVARELTIRAAQKAGLSRIVLIEEPQAAFYAWIDKHSDRWEQLVTPGQTILICDVGGGTTDFTLIRVRSRSDGLVQFHRVAVGDHLILGGDNLDLALAHHLEDRVKPGGQLEPRQWSVLVRSCRQLKEVLLGTNAPDRWTLTLPGTGSKLISGSIQVSVTRQEVEALLIQGFFPDVPLDSKPSASKSGFQEFGLPYATDPAITRHLAVFLTAHREERSASFESLSRPDLPNKQQDPSISERPLSMVLFNGGVFASPLLQGRLVEALGRWFCEDDPNWKPIVLENDRLDLAVARGAAYYGMVRRGEGVRIAAGLARTYYIGVDTSKNSLNLDTSANTSNHAALTESPEGNIENSTGETNPSNSKILTALCLLPAGIEPGHEVDLTEHRFQLLVSQPIEFPLFVSSTRLNDRASELISVDLEQIKELPPIRTVLKSGKSKEAATIDVILKARLTEIGTLDLWCCEVDGKRSWKLLFDIRSTTQTDIQAHQATGEGQGVFDDEGTKVGSNLIAATFGAATHETDTNRSRQSNQSASTDVATLVKRLEEALGIERLEWPTSLLRRLWEVLLEVETGRWISSQHEARWLNLTGFSLRPGYGLAIDDWRCNETWKRLQGKLAFVTTACRAEWYILWRRIAGGLTGGQQQALSSPLLSQLKQSVRQTGSKGKGLDFSGNSHESAELLRLLGSCELLPVLAKRELGDILLEILGRSRFSNLAAAALWALGRVGARTPVYGPLNVVIPPQVASGWLVSLSNLKQNHPMAGFAAMQLARKTGDRYRDVDEVTRTSVLKTLEDIEAPDHYLELVKNVTILESEDQSMIFGESLPKGLRIL